MAHAASSALPSDLDELLDQFGAIQDGTDALLGGLDDEQFNWRPPWGGWSIAQCFDHLNAANRIYMAKLRPALEAARRDGWTRQGPIQSSWLGERFVRSLEPGAGRRLRAVKGTAPADRRHKAEVWPEFVRMHGELRQLIVDAAGLDLNRARFRNPFLPLVSMRAGTAFRVLAAHDRRHLEQARAIRHCEGFPRS